jgi:hypothetical protein
MTHYLLETAPGPGYRKDPPHAKKVWIIFIVSETRKDIISTLAAGRHTGIRADKLPEIKGHLALLWSIKQ